MGLFQNIKDGLKHFESLVHDELDDILDTIEKLPLDRNTYKNVPAIPISLKEIPDTLFKLTERSYATTQAKAGLSNTYTIKGITANGYSFLYSDERKTENINRRYALRKEIQRIAIPRVGNLILSVGLDERLGKNGYKNPMPQGTALNQLSLDEPRQFSISWTTFYDIYNGSQPYLPTWADTLSSVPTANKEFWPTIARYGLAYNLLVLQKLKGSAKYQKIKDKFASVWTDQWQQSSDAGFLYFIDMSIYENFSPDTVRGAERFTPATITLLIQDPDTKELRPLAVAVSGQNGAGLQIYTEGTSTPYAWIYALQAAKCSITVYGIWIGHVYHWHIVTAALQMTMYNSLDDTHPVYKLLAPQSEYLIPFDDVLLLLWQSAAPPTSISTATRFLEFINVFADGRSFCDDDPKATLARNGIDSLDFSSPSGQQWGHYPIVGYILDIWNATEAYVTKYVSTFYQTDASVAADQNLQDWITTSQSPDGGNVQGIGNIKTVAALIGFLTSIVYRVSVHGCGRLNPTANPALSFVPNFPPCLQHSTIPAPGANLTQKDIMDYLPRTGTIGEMMVFYNTFSFSAPYEPFLPFAGNDQNLIFPAQPITYPPNAGLIAFRHAVQEFIIRFTTDLKLPDSIADAPQIYQWPLNIET
jgi:hypothetical protein